MWKSVLFLFLPTASFASQCEIASEMRVPNRSRTQCVWASIETLARHNKVPQLYGITDTYKEKANIHHVEKVLKKKRVRYIMTLKGNTTLLKRYVREKKFGVAFGTNHKHMMTMVHIDDECVKFIDSSSKELEEKTWDLKTFNKAFDGWVIVILGKEK